MSLLAVNRHREILIRLDAEGSVRVTELAGMLDVTEETIRRDLEKLDSQGKLVRIHGGAIPREEDRRELPFRLREAVNLDEKRAIARTACRHVHEGDVIAFDASSSALELARIIPDVRLTVITNCLAVTSALMDRSHLRVISTGGIFHPPTMSYQGSQAERALQQYNIRKCFLSCKGLDVERGLSVVSNEQAGIKRRMIELSDHVFLLVDHTKFGEKAVEFFASVEEVDTIITDAPMEMEFVKQLQVACPAIETTDS